MNLENSITVLPCIDNVPGFEVLRYLAIRDGVRVPAVIVHPMNNALCLAEITEFCSEHHIEVIDINDARKSFDTRIRPLAPDFVVSIYFDYILDERFLRLAKRDSINLHPGYLPYNKGFYYYAWAVLDGTPPGVSIHRMTSEVDAGPIISQKRVHIKKSDTGDVIYNEHIEESIRLFKATWPCLEDNSYRCFPQTHKGTRKKLVQTSAALEINPYQQYAAKDLIDLLRVFSNGNQGGCTIEIDGKRYSVAVRLSDLAEHRTAIPGKTDNLEAKAGT